MAHRKTRADLLAAARRYLDEATASFWTDAQLYAYLNEAKDRVWNEVKKLKADFWHVTRTSTDGSVTILGESYATSSFAIVAGTRDYTLPHDISELKLIEVTTTDYESVRFLHRDLAHPDMRTALAVTENVSPSLIYFDLIGERTMRIAPKSDTALDLRLTYEQAFDDLSATIDLTMPMPLYLAVIYYAVASAMLQEANPNSAVHEARARQIVADVFGAHARQTQDTEIAVGYMEDY